ncbi:MAG: SDR family NAD(P)-dependent oxidoreductase, partial [Microthrixaceae bacterium]
AWGGGGHFHRCDISDDASVAEMLHAAAAESGRLDGIVHNATSGRSPIAVPLESVEPNEFQDHVRVGLRGMFLLARHGQPLLQASRGSFVVLTSEAGFEGKRKLAPYAVIKGAQRGAMRVLAREWGPLGIRVNAVAPLASTPAMVRAFESDPQMEARVMGRNPLGRLGEPAQDIGPVVRFLLSEDARYVTGQTIMADGGSCPIT